VPTFYVKHVRRPFIVCLEPTYLRHITDASLDFGVQPGVGAFIQQLFLDFARRLARMEAMFMNAQIRSRNRRFKTLSPLRPLQKHVSLSSRYAVHLHNSNLIPLDSW
jgi:hypothetical protein